MREHIMPESWKSRGYRMKIIKRIVFVILAVIVAALYSYGIWPRAIYNTDIGANSYENTGALSEGAVLKQSFVCSDTGLCGFSIKLTKQDSQTIGTYKWVLTEAETDKKVAEGKIDESSTENSKFVSSSAQKRGNVEVKFSEIPESKDKEYILTVQGDSVEDNETMAVYITEKSEHSGELQLNGETLEKSSVIKLCYKRFNVETFIVFLVIVAYLVVFVKFMYKLFR